MSQSYSSGGKQFVSPIGNVITERIGCGNNKTVTSSTPTSIWGDSIASSDYPGRVFTFQAYGSVTRAGLTGTVTLYNVTSSSTVISLSFTSITPGLQSASISLTSTYTYEVRVSLTGFSSSPDALELSSSTIVVR